MVGHRATREPEFWEKGGASGYDTPDFSIGVWAAAPSSRPIACSMWPRMRRRGRGPERGPSRAAAIRPVPVGVDVAALRDERSGGGDGRLAICCECGYEFAWRSLRLLCACSPQGLVVDSRRRGRSQRRAARCGRGRASRARAGAPVGGRCDPSAFGSDCQRPGSRRRCAALVGRVGHVDLFVHLPCGVRDV